jgi:putative nucleotidyltransferase with HDIG domain
MDDYYDEQDGYMVIPTESLLENEVTDFDVYIKMNGNYLFYRSKELPFGQKEKLNLMKSSVNVVYVDIKDKDKYDKYLEKNLGAILTNQSTSVEKRGKILYSYSTHLIEEALDEKRAGEEIRKAIDLVKHTVDFLTSEEDAFNNFLNLVNYDYYTYTHCVNVSLFSIGIGHKIGIEDKEELSELGTGAILHDIGKSRIDKGVLNKCGPLSDEEWALMKQHTLWGEEICRDIGIIPKNSYYAILQHHEKCNGKGYPEGREKDNIHLFGRITSIADVFDALTTNRSYASAEDPFPAVKIMLEEMNGSFDMDIFKEFIVLLGSADVPAKKK